MEEVATVPLWNGLTWKNGCHERSTISTLAFEILVATLVSSGICGSRSMWAPVKKQPQIHEGTSGVTRTFQTWVYKATIHLPLVWNGTVAMLCQTAVPFSNFQNGRKRSFVWGNGRTVASEQALKRITARELSLKLLRHSVQIEMCSTNLLGKSGVNLRRASHFHHGHTEQYRFRGVLSTFTQ